ncbi:MAG TPA: ABC transporter substrate-binding protein [Stellaceae bacterium]|nr:ABC transporter substrate-binding protein [Stellaceae bacterium]
MRKFPAVVLAVALAATASAAPALAQKVTTLRVGWCAKTVSPAAAPFAVAMKMGWFAAAHVAIELVPLPGSADCVKFIGTRELLYSLPSVEPLGQFRPQGIRAKVFYTAYQGFTYGIAVPANSMTTAVRELKGKTIGVTSIASGGNLVARALVSEAGLDPDREVSIVVAGEGAQSAALLRSKQVDALAQFDTQFAMVENAGIPLRRLETPSIDHFPANGFIALEDTLKDRRAEAVALAQGYAKGTAFAIANPEAAVRILWEVFPQTKSTGKDEATALRDDIKTLQARAQNWKLERGGVKRWGESVMANHQAYLDFLLKQGVLKEPVKADDIVTNDLIDDINKFAAAAVVEEAQSYKYAAH